MSADANDDTSFNPVNVASAVDSSNVIRAMIAVVTIDDAETTEIAIDEATFNHYVDVTPIEIEKSKVHALNRQLSRSQDENRQLQSLVKQAQADLERQIQQTLQLQKRQTKMCIRDAIDRPVPVLCEEVQKLKVDVASAHKYLADELETAKNREAKLLQLQEQVISLKQQREQQEIRDEKQSDMFIKNLMKQRNELLVVIKKQTNVIDILKQQRAHAEAAVLLDMAENDFLKVVNSRQ
jgi:hypothetical protein